MFKLNPADVAPPALSVTWKATENDPATVGIPEMIPVEEDKGDPREAGRSKRTRYWVESHRWPVTTCCS